MSKDADAFGGGGTLTQPTPNPFAQTEPTKNIEDVGELPVLPLEVLAKTLDQLDSIKDLASVALCSCEWRELINSCDGCWEKAFLRDYNTMNAADYSRLPTWRQRYIACTLDITCLKLRERGEVYDELEDLTAALERSMQNSVTSLAKIDKTLSKLRINLKSQLTELSACSSTHRSPTIHEVFEAVKKLTARTLTDTAASDADQGGGVQDGEAEWHQNLTLQRCQSVLDASVDVEIASRYQADQREVLKKLMEALTVQRGATKKVQESIDMLRRKRESLEAATKYRHSMRRC